MKKSILAALVAILALAFAGCVRMDLNVDFNKDGTGAYNMVIAYNSQYFQEDQIAKSSSEPIKHYNYDGQDWIGYEKSKDFDSWKDLADELPELQSAGTDGENKGLFQSASIDKKVGLLGTTYVFDAETLPISTSDGNSIGSLDSYIKFNINIRMPGKPVESSLKNAVINEDGSVSIQYSADNNVVVHAEFEDRCGVRLDLGITVNNDSGEYSGTVGYDTSFFSKDFISAGTNKKLKDFSYDGKNYTGYEIGDEYDSISELTDALSDMSKDGSVLLNNISIKKKSSFFTDTYVFDAVTVPVSGSDVESNLICKTTLSMPGRIDKDSLKNADVDDGVIVFEYQPDKELKLHAETSQVRILPIVLIIAGVLILVTGIVIVTVVLVSKKKRNSTFQG